MAQQAIKRFIEGEDRSQSVLFPERLDDYIGESNPVRAIDAFSLKRSIWLGWASN